MKPLYNFFKDNKKGIFYSSLVILLGSLLIALRFDAPIEYAIPFGLVNHFILIFLFGIFIGGGK